MKAFLRRLCVLLMVSIFVASTSQQAFTGEGKVIKFWIYGGAQIRDPIKKVCADFEK